MNKSTLSLIAKIEKTDSILDKMLFDLKDQIKDFFDFEINVTILAGDGLAIMREDGYDTTGMGIDEVLALIKKDKFIDDSNWNSTL